MSGFDDPDLRACAEIVEKGDPLRFRATMAAPVAARESLFPIYAFNVEISRAPWVTQEPLIADMRLQWWRDVLTEISEGGPVRRHEVATPLASVLSVEGAEQLQRAVDARRWDIERRPFEDEAGFEAHLRDTATVLLSVAARSLGPVEEAVLAPAGRALGLANWLCAIPALEASGRIPLVDGRAEAVRALARSGLRDLAQARRRRDQVSPDARPAFLCLWQAGAVLKAALRDPGRVSEGRLVPAPGRTGLGLLARAITRRW